MESQQSFASQDTSSTLPDAEFKAMVLHRLTLLLHAFNCQTAENVGCDLISCRAMQAILTHMRSCDMTEHCPFPHCQSSAQILDHWSYCVAPNCAVCMPLKQQIPQISLENASGETKQVSNVLNVPNVSKVPNVPKKLKHVTPPKMSLNGHQQNVQASQVIKIKKL